MATSYTDGNIIADSFTTTIGGQTYIINNLSLTVPQVAAERNDEKGALAAKRSEEDLGRINGSCEVQVPASANNIKLQFEVFDIPTSVLPTEYAGDYVVEEESLSVVVNESRVKSLTIRRSITQS